MGRAVLPPLPPLVARSACMGRVADTLERLAAFDLPVLLLGETGTGKEVAARRLHEAGVRSSHPFVAVNCAAVTPTVAASELFGHVRGAFTGADRTRAGAFARAGGGTLFLDEVAELSPELQAMLLRVLETGTFTPVGADLEVTHGARLVAATCRDLEAMMAEGTFREDLYHRLGVVTVRIPPLRERGEDIEPLLRQFVDEARRRLGIPVELAPGAAEAARRLPWPGNVRQLKNAVLRAAALGGGRISPALLAEGSRPKATTARSTPRGDVIPVPKGTYAEMRSHLLRTVVAEAGSIRRAAARLSVPRSTLAEWLKTAEGTGGPSMREAAVSGPVPAPP